MQESPRGSRPPFRWVNVTLSADHKSKVTDQGTHCWKFCYHDNVLKFRIKATCTININKRKHDIRRSWEMTTFKRDAEVCEALHLPRAFTRAHASAPQRSRPLFSENTHNTYPSKSLSKTTQTIAIYQNHGSWFILLEPLQRGFIVKTKPLVTQ